MLNFLAEEATTTGNDWVTWLIFGLIIALMVVYFVWSSKRNKKKQEEAMELINAVKPGNKVKTIGGICGIVVEVDDEENTFVLETGSEVSGKSFIKFDKQAIYQTDAVVSSATENKEEPFVESADSEEQPAEEKTEE